VSLDGVAAAAQAGAQAITWLLISFVVFLIPYGMLIAELGSAFPALPGQDPGVAGYECKGGLDVFRPLG
jgi:hypothetical protein